MTPQDAVQYLAQLASDYVRTLPPSAAGPTHATAQEAVSTLAVLVSAAPTEPGDKPTLRAVPAQE